MTGFKSGASDDDPFGVAVTMMMTRRTPSLSRQVVDRCNITI